MRVRRVRDESQPPGLIPPPARRLSGQEPVAGGTVADFWRWAFSDLRVNVARGVYAEWLVGRALGCVEGVRAEWDEFDLVTQDGTRVEVKSAAYLQAWEQKKPSTIAFSRLSGQPNDEDQGTDRAVRQYRADVFVFAVLITRDHSLLDPLDTDQWRFWVASREAVAATGYRSLSLAAVERIAGESVGFDGLPARVCAVAADPGRALPQHAPAGIAHRLTEPFWHNALDLSERPGAPAPGEAGMPEVRAAATLRAGGATDAQVRTFLVLVTAMDRARESDQLWAAAARMWEAEPWVFAPREDHPDARAEVATLLRTFGVSRRHRPDSAAWSRILDTLRSPETGLSVVRAVIEGQGDAVQLLSDLKRSSADGLPLFPLLKGEKLGPVCVRILAFPGGASLDRMDDVPVGVDVQVARASRHLGVADISVPPTPAGRRLVQGGWRDEVARGGAVGPDGLNGTTAAVDPALWFHAKWGCKVCEDRGRRLPIGPACASCDLE